MVPARGFGSAPPARPGPFERMNMDAFLDDPRPILSLSWDSGQCYVLVNTNGVMSIGVERVAGQCGLVPWFVVHRADGSFSRHNAAFMEEVVYAPPKGPVP